jgi:peptide-methionine (S)-S-oxide reductase
MSKPLATLSTPRHRKGKWPLLGVVAIGLLALLYLGPVATAEKARSIPAPSQEVLAADSAKPLASDSIVFAGGCFWGIQAVFQHTRGVLNAVSGYAGGKSSTADYETVSSGSSGHAESVQVTFDPKQVSYAQLLQIYFSVAHDPTQLNRQYPDVGTQYRSTIFYQGDGQKLVAQRYIAQLDSGKAFDKKIATQVDALDKFYPAERYHQNYATLHPDSTYIARFDLPKIGNLKALFPALYRDEPVLVAQ